MTNPRIPLVHAAVVVLVILVIMPVTLFAAAQVGRVGNATRAAAGAVRTAAESNGAADPDNEPCRGVAFLTNKTCNRRF